MASRESACAAGSTGSRPAAKQRFAAFDTRAKKPVLLVGSAARGIARRMRERAYTPAVEPESFFVEGTPGPLEEGELERAQEWGRRLASEVSREAVMI